MKNNCTYLALGDSYTIGEAEVFHQNFPSQTVQILRKKGYDFSAPEIIARTGWTTNELWDAIESHTFTDKYDFVSLLIGVNDQYRGESIGKYTVNFEKLLVKSLKFADNHKENVMVVSIPDYSVTPSCRENGEKIRKEIDMFNTINRVKAKQYKVNYIEITEGSREAANDLSLIAVDGLHPSAKEYKKWAIKIATAIEGQIK